MIDGPIHLVKTPARRSPSLSIEMRSPTKANDVKDSGDNGGQPDLSKLLSVSKEDNKKRMQQPEAKVAKKEDPVTLREFYTQPPPYRGSAEVL